MLGISFVDSSSVTYSHLYRSDRCDIQFTFHLFLNPWPLHWYHLLTLLLHFFFFFQFKIVFQKVIIVGPDGMAEWVEHPTFRDRGIQTVVTSNQILKDLYLSLSSQVLGIIRIGQGLTGWLSVSIVWLSEMSGHGAGGLISQWPNELSVHLPF